ncbi:EAL domain-containing protein [Methylomonas paludis]|uniref:EAL domain-containing protein n=1 Tax=Methylomonas paludis TaxID=1173101 RepID=A0A975MPI0_9GAMM|nr:EAL domain-containing protein [Methylomonas paludis]QWF71602.1 EAL domain-containing protein [Methylomonas paludis]
MTAFFIGRQQIFDSKLETFAYELLFRGTHFDLSAPEEATHATNQVISDTILQIGLNEIVGPHKAFINFTDQNLLEKTPLNLPNDRIVIEVLETVTVNDAIINSIRELSQAGFTIALDDFVLSDAWLPVLEYVDIIKIDVLANDLDYTRRQIELLKPYKLRLLAEKVQTREEYELLKSWGCELFQGFFFSEPHLVSGIRMDVDHASALQLLAAANKADACYEDIGRIIGRDVSLSYKLLHYINSAFFALPMEIESIPQAISFLGLKELQRWVNILMLSSLSVKPRIVLQFALIRARMCELLAHEMGEDGDRYFLVGMLSSADAILGVSMDRAVQQLPLTQEVAEAILHKSGKTGQVLEYAMSYQPWEVSAHAFQNIDPQRVAGIYLDSILWAGAVLGNIGLNG